MDAPIRYAQSGDVSIAYQVTGEGDLDLGIERPTAARVAAFGCAGDVITSATTRDLVAGSGLAFADAGEHELKGIDERRRLYTVDG